jgi:hypothetical protein
MTDEPDAIWELPPDIEEKMESTIKQLHREGKLPPLERLTEVLVETRKKYREKILRARNGEPIPE